MQEPPEEPLLEKIAEWLLKELPKPRWTGAASELADALKIQEKPYILTRKLNVLHGRLCEEYNVYYETARTHKGRYIILAYAPPEKPAPLDEEEDENDDCI